MYPDWDMFSKNEKGENYEKRRSYKRSLKNRNFLPKDFEIHL